MEKYHALNDAVRDYMLAKKSGDPYHIEAAYKRVKAIKGEIDKNLKEEANNGLQK